MIKQDVKVKTFISGINFSALSSRNNFKVFFIQVGQGLSCGIREKNLVMSHSSSAPTGCCASPSAPSATVILGPQARNKSLTHPALPLVSLSDVKICDKDPVYSPQCWHQKYGNMTEKQN